MERDINDRAACRDAIFKLPRLSYLYVRILSLVVIMSLLILWQRWSDSVEALVNPFDKSLSPADIFLVRNNTGHSPGDALSSLFDIVLAPQTRKLVVHCRQGCRGIADRIRGIPFAATIAFLSGRQLIVDKSYLSYVPVPADGPDYRFDDQCSTPAVLDAIQVVLAEESPTIFMKSSCFELPRWEDVLEHGDDRLSTLVKVSQQCSQPITDMENAYKCGAAAFRAAFPHVKEFRDGFAAVQGALQALWQFLPTRNYTVLQIRAGGSSIYVDGKSVPALSWGDAYISESPNLWIRAFQRLAYSECRTGLVVLSDSTRVLSEIRHAARDRLMVVNCCSQPLHRDQIKSRSYEFYLQEVVDLFVIAGAQKIVSGPGNFVTLGRYWQSYDDPPQLVRAETEQAINEALFEVLKESGCRNVAVPADG